jgi:hypothetical protein
MAELKTKVNSASVEKFLDSVTPQEQRQDCYQLLEMMQKLTGEPPKMWGKSIVGFGSYHYRYASGREGDWFVCGFSPRKANISIYLPCCDISQMSDDLDKLGKHSTGKSCLYIKKLEDVNTKVLKRMIKRAIEGGNKHNHD